MTSGSAESHSTAWINKEASFPNNHAQIDEIGSEKAKIINQVNGLILANNPYKTKSEQSSQKGAGQALCLSLYGFILFCFVSKLFLCFF